MGHDNYEDPVQCTYMTTKIHEIVLSSVGVVQRARDFVGKITPHPLKDVVGPRTELALLTRLESRNTTMTVMSS